MKNNLLDYLSVLHSVFQEFTDSMDHDLSLADDGEPHTITDSRAISIDIVNDAIEKLEKLKVELKVKNIEFLKNKY
jgi:hypothetical protein